KATETDSLKVDASAPKIVGLGLSAQSQLVDESARGNKITVVFKNVSTLKMSAAQAAACKKNPKTAGCPPIIMMTPTNQQLLSTRVDKVDHYCNRFCSAQFCNSSC